MADPTRKILIADDVPDDREMVRRSLPPGYSAREAGNLDEAEALFEREDIYLAFVDVFLDDANERAAGLELGTRLAERIPVIYFSDKEDRTQAALRNSGARRLKFLDKNRDFARPADVHALIADCAGDYYSGIRVDFPNSSASWANIATKLYPKDDPAARADTELELLSLFQRATHGWDGAATEAVRASRVDLLPISDSGDNSIVLRMRPYSLTNDPHADVVLKITRSRGEDGRDEHTQFDRFKNVIGGYGLRERRHALSSRFQAQIYAVPYFELDQTRTFAAYFRDERDSEAGLRRISELVASIFDEALRPLNRRRLSGDDDLELAEYYRGRISAAKRFKNITNDLTRADRPTAIAVTDGELVVQCDGKPRRLRNPAVPVLGAGKYECASERVSTQLRHGDFHAGNILVDPDRASCWYLDYESMGEGHFHLVDHVEFEADVLFSLMRIDQNYEFMARLIDTITGPSLDAFDDVSDECNNPRDLPEARKAVTAVRAIRRFARLATGAGPVRPYYHALMYEALRVAGKVSFPREQRWRALVAAAVIFDKLETVFAHVQ